MIGRGSLKKCIEILLYQFNHAGEKQLSIVHVPRGKYYIALTEDMLLDYNRKPKSDEMRLLFRGTERELSQFAKLVPADLFDTLEPDEGTPTQPER